MDIELDYASGGEVTYHYISENKKFIVSTLMLSMNLVFYMYKRPFLYRYIEMVRDLQELIQDYDQNIVSTANEYFEIFNDEYNVIEFTSKVELEEKLLHLTQIAKYYELSPLTYCFAAISLITFFYSESEINEFLSDGFNQASVFLLGAIDYDY